jgi:hypothetical protein
LPDISSLAQREDLQVAATDSVLPASPKIGSFDPGISKQRTSTVFPPGIPENALIFKPLGEDAYELYLLRFLP